MAGKFRIATEQNCVQKMLNFVFRSNSLIQCNLLHLLTCFGCVDTYTIQYIHIVYKFAWGNLCELKSNDE